MLRLLNKILNLPRFKKCVKNGKYSIIELNKVDNNHLYLELTLARLQCFKRTLKYHAAKQKSFKGKIKIAWWGNATKILNTNKNQTEFYLSWF